MSFPIGKGVITAPCETLGTTLVARKWSRAILQFCNVDQFHVILQSPQFPNFGALTARSGKSGDRGDRRSQVAPN